MTRERRECLQPALPGGPGADGAYSSMTPGAQFPAVGYEAPQPVGVHRHAEVESRAMSPSSAGGFGDEPNAYNGRALVRFR